LPDYQNYTLCYILIDGSEILKTLLPGRASPVVTCFESQKQAAEEVNDRLRKIATKKCLPYWSIVLFGVFRTVDLGQQYDTVPHFGGIFSFNSTIHSGVSYSA